MLRLKPSLIEDLLNQAETGMGYQTIEATLDDDTTKRGVVLNTEVLLFDDESFVDLARHFRLFEYSAALQVLDIRPPERRVKALRVISQASARQQTASVKESPPAYGKQMGSAADAPPEKTNAGDIFRRFCAFPNDRRIRSDGGVEAVFVKGTHPKTVTGMKKLEDK
jgi:hypothetical protein